MRIVHPEKVDIAYASSAPLNLYSQNVDSHDYYNLVTRVAESASGGCSKAVKETLMEVHSLISSSNDLSAEMTKLNICTETFPDYIKTTDLLASELMAIVGQNFACKLLYCIYYECITFVNEAVLTKQFAFHHLSTVSLHNEVFNMFDYPPGPATLLNQACNIFQNSSLSPYEKMDQFFHLVPVANELQPSECGFDISIQIPAGRDATISTSDWTGSGFGKTGRSWDFHCCTELIVQTGFSEISMFYPKEWSLDWLTEHCQKRFGVSPAPYKLVNNYSFDDLSNVSRILFTNGLKDGWSESSIKESPNENIVVINMPNGGKSLIRSMRSGNFNFKK
jgi:lysosomal Pro-X carboxypeptidase